MVMYMYIAPGQGQTFPLGSKSFQKHKYSVNLVIYCKFYTLNNFETFFLFKRIGVQIDLDVKQVKVTPGSSYINLVELETPMLHAKFQDHRSTGRREEMFLPYMGMAAILVM